MSAGTFRDATAVWIEQTSNSPEFLGVIHALTPEIAWAVGDQGRVVVTTDGGLNWVPRSVPGATELSGLFALSDRVAVVADQYGHFWRTTDAGIQWVQVHGGTGSSINGIHFFDEQNGWALGDPANGQYVILLSSDGGSSWNQSPTAPPGTGFGYVKSYDWIGTQTGVFSTRRWVIWRTTDGGAQWDSVGIDIQFIRGIELSDPGLALASGHTGGVPLLRRSTDSGATWTQAVHPAQATPLRNLDWIEGTSEVWGVTAQTGLFQSTNEGIDWERHTLAPPTEFVAMDVDFTDQGTGWCVGYNPTGPGRIFMWSTTTRVLPDPAAGGKLKVVTYPNPFRSEMVLEIETMSDTPTECGVYDVAGHWVWMEHTAAGTAGGFHRYRWDGRDPRGQPVANGVYFYRVRTATREISGRVVRIP